MAQEGTRDPLALRDRLVTKVEQHLVHRAELYGKGLIQHFRLILQDLPFDGNPELLADIHRAAIEHLVERATRFDLRILSIIGHASQPGDDQYNLNLSQARAEAVYDYLLETIDNHADVTRDILRDDLPVVGQGEAMPQVERADEADDPLNRRVEITFRIRQIFPQSPTDAVPRSRFWKIDFGISGSTPIGLAGGTGTLTMLPDDLTQQATEIEKPLTWEALGLSVSLTGPLRKTKFIRKFPLIRRLLVNLDRGLPGNYTRTAEVLEATGFSVDLASGGGWFETDEPLAFEDMANFNFAALSSELTLTVGAGVSGSATLLLLHSPNFFAYTVNLGVDMSVAFPDAQVAALPLGWVQLEI